MKPGLFYSWILILTLGYLQGYHVLRNHFSGKAGLQKKVAKLETELERERLRLALVDFQMKDFRETVASLIPHQKDLNYAQRNLASVVVAPDSEKLKIERASSLFQKGRTAFSGTHFEESNEIFLQLIRQYPGSVHLPEAYFLLAEGRYQTRDYDECLDVIETMINLYPENHLTGFAMLRMGQIFSERDRIEDAEQVFRAILANFQHEALQSQAKTLLREISL